MATFDELDTATRTELEAAAFRRLLKHLDDNKDVQNIDLMILADFCRNCLSKWLVSAADERGTPLEMDAAREYVYGMPYSEWKANHQGEATPEQLAALDARQARKKAPSQNESPSQNEPQE
ncbi:deoxycytidine triphosphate deaminase [Vreelandella venusta]|nr:deoxycytidine triphosphate deaminase [Halomonas hydrothermalis]